MSDQLKAVVGGVVRHGFNTLGAMLMAKGLLGEDDVSAFVGGGMALFSVAWSLLRKHLDAKKA